MKKTVHLGRGKYGKVFCRIEFEDGRLSICGVEGPKKNGDASGGCGQIRDVELVRFAPGWDAETVEAFRQTWERWHLNDMRAGCEHQRAEGWTHCPGHYLGEVDIERANRDLKRDGVALVRGTGRHYYCTDISLPDGYTEICEGNVKALGTACPICGYHYGSAWLREEVPPEVVTYLAGLPDTDVQPAWV